MHSCSTTGKLTALFVYFLLLSVALSIPYGLISFSSQWWYHQAIVFYPCLFFRSVRWYLEFRAALSILNAVPLITSIGLPNMRLTRGFLTLISTLPNRSSSTPMWKTKAARPRCFCFSIAVPILSVWMRKTCCVCFPLLIGLGNRGSREKCRSFVRPSLLPILRSVRVFLIVSERGFLLACFFQQSLRCCLSQQTHTSTDGITCSSWTIFSICSLLTSIRKEAKLMPLSSAIATSFWMYVFPPLHRQ